ncbi:hypothetical protein DMN91_005552 [Ooceraea biroi]|uniref:Odorant receptor n=1 Tax=Ooceraea biroi TaxID=2015173 RepID=A0A3L8DMM7_OOCBI|nr:uncharacterized protein LOC105287078 isoform X3 [Ooceraea biroi]RLU21179.1 hypothetical protein DMN91_005552 [Ooceraea biroi]
MICIESLQIRLNRILLLLVGLWPYQQSRLVRVQLVVLFTILTTFILFQFATFATSKCTSDLSINILSSTLFCAIFVIKYSSFRINIDIVKSLLEQLQHMYNELMDKNEIIIIEKYGRYAKRYTAIFTLLAIFIAFGLILYPFSPRILDILWPVNESRQRPSLLFMTEYFVDQERYFYLIFLHANVAICIGGFVMLATGTILITYFQHACGMFRIASYRIEQAMTIGTLDKGCLGNDNLIYKGLIYAVDMHRKAMKFSDSSVSKFKVMISLLLIFGVICWSLNLFRIFQVMSFKQNFMEISLPIIFVIVHFTYMILGNYLAQEITDHNNDVFTTVYNVQWYLAPLHVQKMILFLLQRSTRTFTLNVGGLFIGSLEGAATLLSTSISYFTVLYSTQ